MIPLPDGPNDGLRPLDEMGSLSRGPFDFIGFAELPPYGAKQGGLLRSSGEATALRERLIDRPKPRLPAVAASGSTSPGRSSLDPTGYAVFVIEIYGSEAEILRVVRARIPASRRAVRRVRVRRVLLRIEAFGADVIDARALGAQLTAEAIALGEEEAWILLDAARMLGAEVVLVSGGGSGDTIVVFETALGSAVVEQDSGVFVFDREGRAEREPVSKGRLEGWVFHIPIALGAAVVAHPVATGLAGLVGLSARLPVIVPVAVAFGALAAIEVRRRK